MIEYNGRGIMFLCTSKCNNRCEHCYISYSGARDPIELFNAVKILKNKYKIILNGAEILTNLEYLKSFKEIGQRWIMSNGLALLNEQTIQALHENEIKSVSISYHFGIQDDVSGITISMLENIINSIKNGGLEFRLLTTITSKNYELIEKMCKEAYNMGAKGIMFNNLISQGNGACLDKSLILNSEQIKRCFELINHTRKVYDKSELIIERSGTFGRNMNDEKNHFCCDYGTGMVCITPDNNIYPCIYMAKPGYEIGKFVDNKIMLYDEIQHSGNMCIAQEVFNNGKSLNKILRK